MTCSIGDCVLPYSTMYGFWSGCGKYAPAPYSSGGMTPNRHQDDFLSKGIYTSMFPSLATFKNVSFLTAPERVKFKPVNFERSV